MFISRSVHVKLVSMCSGYDLYDPGNIQGRSRTSFIVLYVDTGRDTVTSMVPNMADVVAVVDLVIVPNTCTISFFVMAVSS